MYGMYEQSRLRTAWALRMHSSQTVEIETFSVDISEMRILPSYRRGIAVKYYNAKVAMAVLKWIKIERITKNIKWNGNSWILV